MHGWRRGRDNYTSHTKTTLLIYTLPRSTLSHINFFNSFAMALKGGAQGCTHAYTKYRSRMHRSSHAQNNTGCRFSIDLQEIQLSNSKSRVPEGWCWWAVGSA